MAANLIPTAGGSPIALDKPIMLIGRNQSCDISIQTSSKVSRRHCCIVQCGRKYLLRDLGSMNGVRVNSNRIREIELRSGDHLAIADILFTFSVDEAEARDANRLKQHPKQGLPPTESPNPLENNKSPDSMPDVSDPEMGSNTFSDGEIPAVSEDEMRLKDDSESRPEFVKT
jgi:pSer/pThr/pTyr-binding forkhead associated (FHA) protein